MEATQVYVKLRDRGTIFHDTSTKGNTVSGDEVKLLTRSPNVNIALKQGTLVEVAERDVPKAAKQAAKLTIAEQEAEDKRVAEEEALRLRQEATQSATEAASAKSQAEADKKAADEAAKRAK